MPELDVETIVDQLTHIGLISRDQFIEARMEAEDGSPEALVRYCLRRSWITSWQLERMKKGDVTHFFFGPYRALFHLAEGTFARVYRGERTNTGEAVAIKVLRGRFAADPEAVAAFRKEAEAGMRLQHDNIVRVLDYGDQDDKHFIIMEYVEGMNLRELLRLRHNLRGKEALPLMINLAAGLAYAHGNGVGHRDIKGTNILVSNSGVAKLVDFGLANIDEDGKVGRSQRTIDYSALERSCGSPKGDHRSDIYFLGCVFYYMLTGQVPLEDSESKDPLKKMLKRSFSIIRPISEHRNAPDPALAQIVEKMMKMDLRSRYQTINQVLADLEAFRDGKLGTDAPISDDELEIDPEIGSALFRNPFISTDPEAPENRAAAEEAALALDLEHFESQPDEADLDALLGTPPVEAEPEPVAVVEPAPAPPAPEPHAAAPPTLLCVEPLTEIQDVLRKSLTRRGYRILMIADAERAAERYGEEPADAVLFDVDGLGPQALSHLEAMRDRAKAASVPFRVLVLLGPRQGALQEKLPSADQLAVLSKPLKLKDVLEALDRLAPVV
ncbi:serine/threonine-protein kinase [Paludisphaera rhizosphaerae]|uniref:serine/threonine-protein kinase n=1 Tax=Paludisphaera rhizosphaerae TaxID=2711216 RepID=UPI0013E9A191|nr:serine/threonine-protein kinase [Paludisphaera rhizosphaerae]